jgi:hypothetical protein
MRSVNLIKVAIEAEILRYKSMAARQGRRARFGVAALIFGLGFLITLEIAGWQVARMYMLPIYATLCLMGLNFVVAAVFGFVAMRSSPGQSETDAGGTEEGRAGAADINDHQRDHPGRRVFMEAE